MSGLRERIQEAITRSVADDDRTAVVDSGSGVVQWLAAPEGVFHIEVIHPDGPDAGRSLWQRLRRPAADASFDERQVAALTGSGFVRERPGYVLRPEYTGVGRVWSTEQAVHAVVTVLRDVFGVRDDAQLDIEIF